MFNIFGRNSITYNVEMKNKLKNKVEVLKKQQKVAAETILKNFEIKRNDLASTTRAEIAMLEARIASLKHHQKVQSEILGEEQKVELEKSMNTFDAKILTINNKIKRLSNSITAENQNIQDVLNPTNPNAPEEQVKRIEPMGFTTDEKAVKVETKKTTKSTTKKTSK